MQQIIMQTYHFAVIQGNHQNFDPSLLHYKCRLTFEGINIHKKQLTCGSTIVSVKAWFSVIDYFSSSFFPQVFTHFLHLENKVLDFPHPLMPQLIFLSSFVESE